MDFLQPLTENIDLITDPDARVHVHVKHSARTPQVLHTSQVQHLFPNLRAVIEPNANGALGPERQSERLQPLEVQEGNEGADRGSDTTGAAAHPQTSLYPHGDQSTPHI